MAQRGGLGQCEMLRSGFLLHLQGGNDVACIENGSAKGLTLGGNAAVLVHTE